MATAEKVTLELPRLVAGRDLAEGMVAAFRSQHADLQGTDVVIDATGLRSGTASFAVALVEGLFVDAGVDSIELVGGPTDFGEYVERGASAAGRLDAVRWVATAGR